MFPFSVRARKLPCRVEKGVTVREEGAPEWVPSFRRPRHPLVSSATGVTAVGERGATPRPPPAWGLVRKSRTCQAQQRFLTREYEACTTRCASGEPTLRSPEAVGQRGPATEDAATEGGTPWNLIPTREKVLDPFGFSSVEEWATTRCPATRKTMTGLRDSKVPAR